jgi:cytochrome c oxidase assembly protein subunit 15
LGCPDWPGCYGYLNVPDESHEIALANAAYPERPVEIDKAWKEMAHRYLAGILGLLILAMAAVAIRHHRDPGQPVRLPLALLVLVVFQAALGMWTVTLFLKPVVVVAHLLGGMATLALLFWLVLRQGRYFEAIPLVPYRSLAKWAALGLAVVAAQVALGGWTSANYAALACPDFPTCQGYWWPPTDAKEAFTLWRGVGVSYEGGVLDNTARVTIHVVHRMGAVVTLCYLGWLVWRLQARAGNVPLRHLGALLGLLVAGQVGLGIANVTLQLPLGIAVAHNAVAALLILIMVALNSALRPQGLR